MQEDFEWLPEGNHRKSYQLEFARMRKAAENQLIDSVSKVKRVLDLFLIILVIGPLMNHDGTEYQKHFSHTCDPDCHFLLSFFEEAFLKLLKCWDFGNTDNRVQVQNLANSAGRLSAHVRRVDART